MARTIGRTIDVLRWALEQQDMLRADEVAARGESEEDETEEEAEVDLDESAPANADDFESTLAYRSGANSGREA